MNEQIKDLAGKALDKAVPYTWHNLDHVEVERVMKEFAKLIVRECADISDASFHNGSAGYTAILKHFGVE